MKFFKFARKVRNDEDGAVTVDWVVLTAAIVVLGGVVMAAIRTGVVDAASHIGDYLSSTATNPTTLSNTKP